MDAAKLLEEWPDWSRAGAARVLASPAWRMDVRLGDVPAVLTTRADPPSDALALAVKLDGEPHVLSLGLSPRFPDLWRLRELWERLPEEVRLALVERECGFLFQFLEDAFNLGVSVAGFAADACEGTVFGLEDGSDPVVFALDLPRELGLRLGRIENLDVRHESIRALTRDVRAVYAALPLDDVEAGTLAAGDFLLLPDDSGAEGGWRTEIPSDGRVFAVSPDAVEVTFAQFADDALPPVPPCGRVELVRGGRVLGFAEAASVGLARALRVLSVST